MQENYTKIHRDLSTAKLLTILDNRETYRPDAVQSAEEELKRRELSSSQMSEARNIIEQEESARSKTLGRVIERKANQTTSQIFDHINPLTRKTPEQGIRLFCGLMVLELLYTLLTNLSFIGLMFSETQFWSTSSAVYFIPYVYLPITIVLLLQKKRAGWTMAIIWLTHSTVSVLLMYLQELQFEDVSVTGEGGIFELFQNPTNGLPYYIGQFAFFLSTIIYLNTQAIKALYNVNRTTALVSMVVTSIVTAVIGYPL